MSDRDKQKDEYYKNHNYADSQPIYVDTDTIRDDQMNKFEQIVMEFHYPFSDNEVGVFDKINKNHYLIHFHGNNWCKYHNPSGVRIHRGVTIPEVFECTYLHKKYFVPELNKETIPSPLDMKNTEIYDEIHINYPPFVN
jgi:hypothetical protein